MLNCGYKPGQLCHTGIVNMGIANNSLETELLTYLNSHLQLDPIDLTYGSSLYGSTRLFSALCKHYNGKAFNPFLKVSPQHIIAGPGCGPLLDQIFEHLADEGEGVLCATPYYSGFDADLSMRAKVECVPVLSPFGDGTEADSFEGPSTRTCSTIPPFTMTLSGPTGSVYPRHSSL